MKYQIEVNEGDLLDIIEDVNEVSRGVARTILNFLLNENKDNTFKKDDFAGWVWYNGINAAFDDEFNEGILVDDIIDFWKAESNENTKFLTLEELNEVQKGYKELKLKLFGYLIFLSEDGDCFYKKHKKDQKSS